MNEIIINGMTLNVFSELSPVSESVFSYCAFGWYIDQYYKSCVICLVGFDKNKHAMGFIRPESIHNGVLLPKMICYCSSYRSELNTDNLKTEKEWNRLGFRIKEDSMGDSLFVSRKTRKTELYFGRQEVESL